MTAGVLWWGRRFCVVIYTGIVPERAGISVLLWGLSGEFNFLVLVYDLADEEASVQAGFGVEIYYVAAI